MIVSAAVRLFLYCALTKVPKLANLLIKQATNDVIYVIVGVVPRCPRFCFR